MQYYLMVIPGVLLALTFHELSHGYVACLLGDPTAKSQGRLSLNPIVHIDVIGLICMIVAGIGWAKPVPINPAYFNMRNRKLGVALVSLAGPVSNMLLAFVCLFISILILCVSTNTILLALAEFLYTTAILSIGLAAFNLLPIPPLDGSKVLMPFLPNRVIAFFMRYEGYIRFFLMAVLLLGLLDGVIMYIRNTIAAFLSAGVYWLLGLAGVF